MSTRPGQRKQPRGALFFERLEPRILLSADLLGGFVSDLGEHKVDQPYYDFPDQPTQPNDTILEIWADSTESKGTQFDANTLLQFSDDQPGTLDSDTSTALDPFPAFSQTISPDPDQTIELVFINDDLDDIPGLIDSLEKGENTRLFVFTLDSHSDGVDQISQIISGFTDVSAIHLFGHGQSGEVQIGGSLLSASTFDEYANQLERWQQAFVDQGDLLFYGCDFSSTTEGRVFLDQLAATTQLDIAASDDLTGSTLLGGDWELEVQTGSIATNLTISDLDGTQWQSLLTENASLFITTDEDVTDVDGQTGGLTAWSDHQVIEAGHPFLTSEPGTSNASFASQFNLNSFGSGAHIDAVHIVETNMTIGTTNTIDVEIGDLLLSTDSNATLTGSDAIALSATPDDVFIFRPDVAGDYSSGVFISLLENVSKSNDNVTAISLVESDTFVGDTTLDAGSFIYSTDNENNIQLLTPANLSNPSSSSIDTLVNGDDGIILFILGSEILPSGITGLELVESSIQVGDTTVTAGDILITVDASSEIMDNDLAVTAFDVIRLQLDSTSIPFLSTTGGTASILFQGSDVELDTASANLTALALNSLVNVDPTGSVTISGTPTEDLTLSANTTTIADADGLGTFSYQWLRNGVNISGATSSSYTLDDADVDANITLSVTYLDGNGTAESLLSAGVGPVTNVNDSVTGAVVIDGVVTEDSLLTANTSALSDNDGLGSFSYQWKRDGSNITGANASTYSLDDADVGKNISVQVTYEDGHGTSESVLSAQVGPVTNINDNPLGNVSITGVAIEDNTLVADTTAISDADGLGSFSFQWQRNGINITNATNDSYTLTDADVATNITLVVSYLDARGTSETLTSAAVGPIGNINDLPDGNVVIAGIPTEDNLLTANTAGISDDDGLGAFSYQWKRDGVNIAGATTDSYLLDDIDVGKNITLVVSYTDGNGSVETLESDAVGPVNNINDDPLGNVVVTGSATENNSLTADTSAITDADGLGAFSYQWRRDGAEITGANASSYLLTDDDVAANISVVVTYTDVNGTLESLTSAPVGPVLNVNDLPAGNVVISGIATEDNSLTADTSGITDDDGLGAFSYQWKRDGINIAGAISDTYTLDDIDVGTNITVSVAYTDARGTAESLTSLAVGPVTNLNDAPTGLPNILGTSTEGQNLTADTSGIMDDDGTGVFSYQWQRAGVDIPGANANSYLLAAADVGNLIRVVVTYTDGNGTVESLTSTALGPVANAANNPPTGAVVIDGIATEDQTLSANTTTIADVDGLNPFSYQWRRDGVDIIGATLSTYTLLDADVGSNITVVTSYTDGGGSFESLTSTPVGPIANINDTPAGALVIGGITTEGNSLTVDTTGITDDDGLGSFSYQWQRDGVDIGGANSSSYLLVDDDVDANIRILVSYTDGNGTLETITSTTVGPIINVNSTPTGAPIITGTGTEDQTLTVDTSGIVDADGTGVFSYQWQRNGANITGATSSSYTLVDADVNQNIRVITSYLDARGTNESLTSATVGPINNVNDDPAGAVNITGAILEGTNLVADTSAITDDDGLGAFSFQWQRNGAAITGATANNYTLVDDDVDANIQVVVTYTDLNGTSESLTSAAVGPIQNLNSPATGLPVITGTATEDQTLTADTSAIADAEGLGTFSYQWKRDGADITGATASSYTLVDADVASSISVTTSFTDGRGTVESLTSAGVGPVANINDLPTGQVNITGTLLEGNLLTADTSTIADNDRLGAFSYQWQRDGLNIAGASANSYLLGLDDVGHNISVIVTYTDGNGSAESLPSDQVGPIVDVNTLPTGSVTITGSAIEDVVLVADTSSITDPDGIGIFNYQWLRDGINISGANSGTYQLDDADVGRNISVVAAYVDGNGSAESLTSIATGPVQNINDVPAGNVLVSGDRTVRNILTASTSSITDDDGLGNITLQWQRNGVAIAGATANSYTSLESDIGSNISVVASYVDGNGTAESLTSSPINIIAPANTAPVAIGDLFNASEDSSLVVLDTSGLLQNDTDADPGDSLSVVQVSNGIVTVNTGELIAGTNGGNFIVAADGSYQFDPGRDFQDLAIGETRQTNLVYMISDAAGATTEAMLSVTVQGVNDAPIANPDEHTTSTLQELRITSTEGLLNNDADPDTSDTLLVIGANNNLTSVGIGEPISGTTGGAFIINADGSFTFSPGADFDDLSPGTSRVTEVSYIISDANGGQQTQTLSLVVVGDRQFDDVATDSRTETTNDLTSNRDPDQNRSDTDTTDTNAEDPVATSDTRPVPPIGRTGTPEASTAETTVEDTALAEFLDNELLAGNALFNFDTPFVGPGQIAQQIIYDPPALNEVEADDFKTAVERMRVELLLDEQAPNILSSIDFDRGIDRTRDAVNSESDNTQKIMVGSFAFSAGLSVGYVVWLVRSGILLSSVLSSLPAWRLVDPLPILGNLGQRNDEDSESIQNIVQGQEHSVDSSEQDQHDATSMEREAS